MAKGEDGRMRRCGFPDFTAPACGAGTFAYGLPEKAGDTDSETAGDLLSAGLASASGRTPGTHCFPGCIAGGSSVRQNPDFGAERPVDNLQRLSTNSTGGCGKPAGAA